MLTAEVKRLTPTERLLRGTGVYAIRNRLNGKLYVGSAARSIKRRWDEHRRSLELGSHHCVHLQRAWNKYGAESFELLVLESCLPVSCVEREQFFIDVTNSFDRRCGYNSYPNARSPLGVKRPPHVGQAVAAANRLRQISQETRERMSASRRGKKSTTVQTGMLNSNSKLSDLQVRQIRELWTTGSWKIVSLARMFDVGWTCISDIVSGRKWNHVT